LCCPHGIAGSLIARWWWLALPSCARLYTTAGAWTPRIDHRLCRCVDRLIRLRVRIWSIRVGFWRGRLCGCDARFAL
jgi:hypothetical protein